MRGILKPDGAAPWHWRLTIYAVAAVGCGVAVGANSPEHPWLMTLLGASAMAAVLYALR